MSILTAKLLKPFYNQLSQSPISQLSIPASDEIVAGDERTDTQQDDSHTFINEIKPKKLSAVGPTICSPIVK